jgi:hypothetical protein
MCLISNYTRDRRKYGFFEFIFVFIKISGNSGNEQTDFKVNQETLCLRANNWSLNTKIDLFRVLENSMLCSIMITRWLFILVGNNNTGKTTLQKELIKHLCGLNYTKLPTNRPFDVINLDAPRRLATLFTANRSFQEKKEEYKTVKDYFANYFQDASVAIISSHSHSARIEIDEMIQEGKRRFYNIAAVFFSNSIDDEVRDISSALNWDERIYLDNPHAEDADGVERNIAAAAVYLADVIIGKYTRK